jgi:hypothetical protein
MNSGSSGGTQIAVGVRIRPLLASERDDGGTAILEAVNANTVVDRTTGNGQVFDYVAGPDMRTEQLYAAWGLPRLVNSVVDGINCTLFAYGTTSAGKSHTMTGSGSEELGITQLAVRNIFDALQATPNTEFLVRRKCSLTKQARVIICWRRYASRTWSCTTRSCSICWSPAIPTCPSLVSTHNPLSTLSLNSWRRA